MFFLALDCLAYSYLFYSLYKSYKHSENPSDTLEDLKQITYLDDKIAYHYIMQEYYKRIKNLSTDRKRE